MRRLLWRLTIVALVLLPFVVVVGHPFVQATIGTPVQSGMTYDHQLRGTIASDPVFQFVDDGDAFLTPSGMATESETMIMSSARDLIRDETVEGLARWSPGVGEFARSGPWGGWFDSVGYGWPMVSCAVDYDIAKAHLAPASSFSSPLPPVNGIPLPTLSTSQSASGFVVMRALPTRIEWGGLAMNLVVYALIVYGMMVPTLVFVSRAMARRCWGRGMCGACRYEVGDLSACPECGALRPGGARRVRPSGLPPRVPG